MGEDRELLAQRELDDGLVLAAPEQSEDAPKDRDRESRYGPHRSRILLESRPRREPESGLTLRLPFKDECGHPTGKTRAESTWTDFDNAQVCARGFAITPRAKAPSDRIPIQLCS